MCYDWTYKVMGLRACYRLPIFVSGLTFIGLSHALRKDLCLRDSGLPRLDRKAGLDSGLDFGLDSGLDSGLTLIDL